MLRILGQRSDGYHELQTVFKILNWGDEMQFKFTDSGVEPAISISGFKKLKLEDNLIFQAAAILKPFAQSPCNVSIEVDKVIPQGGGLGGGSSNAASTMKVLNEHWKCQLSQTQLMSLALRLGADVPVFILSKDALAMGVGEHLTPINLPKHHVLLLFPDCAVPTVDVFKSDMLERKQTEVFEKDVLLKPSWINACLPVVLSNYPEIKRVYDLMSENYKVYLSGTGSTLFILFDDCTLAEQAKKMADAICKCHLILAN